MLDLCGGSGFVLTFLKMFCQRLANNSEHPTRSGRCKSSRTPNLHEHLIQLFILSVPLITVQVLGKSAMIMVTSWKVAG